MSPLHTDRQYESELKRLKEMILKAGGVTETMIARSMQALVERNSVLASEVLGKDREINQLQVQIDELCLQLLALRQPIASDLRFIAMGIRVSTDLERIGDLAVNIAEQAIPLNQQAALKPYIDLPKMAHLSQQMLKEVLDSFVARDADRARRVCAMDDEVDALCKSIFVELIEMMQEDPHAVERGVRLILVARHLERVADHATNIAEEVVFMVRGQDIRHGG